MIALTLDAQNNRIVIEDNEAEKALWAHDLSQISPPDKITGTLGTDYELAEIQVNNVDFEGLVFRLIDKNGQQWSTEIIGMTVTGQY